MYPHCTCTCVYGCACVCPTSLEHPPIPVSLNTDNATTKFCKSIVTFQGLLLGSEPNLVLMRNDVHYTCNSFLNVFVLNEISRCQIESSELHQLKMLMCVIYM